jgi:hypothetical protein
VCCSQPTSREEAYALVPSFPTARERVGKLRGGAVTLKSLLIRAGTLASFLLLLFAMPATPALASSSPTAGQTGAEAIQPSASVVSAASTNCHWHTDGNVYWAHCYDTGAPYSFQMHVWCSQGFNGDWQNDSFVAQSPRDAYTNGINCNGNGHVTSAWVSTWG